MRFSVPVALLAAAVMPSSLFAQAKGGSELLVPLQPAAISAPGMKFTIPHSVLYFNANVGSFKILGNEAVRAEGQLDFTFKGTVLISDLDPGSVIKVSGNVRREIHDEKLHKDLYFGEGRITVVGRFRAVQFFGRELRARYDGFGVVRMVGEFDKNLETGRYWYAGEERKDYWQTSLITVNVPKYEAPKPKIKVEGGGKG